MSEVKLTLKSFLQELKRLGVLEQLRLSVVAAKAYCDYGNYSGNISLRTPIPEFPQKHTDSHIIFSHHVFIMVSVGEGGILTYTPKVRALDLDGVPHTFTCEQVLEGIAEISKPEMIRVERMVDGKSDNGLWVELSGLTLYHVARVERGGGVVYWISSNNEGDNPTMVRLTNFGYPVIEAVWASNTPGILEAACAIADDHHQPRPIELVKCLKKGICNLEKP